MSKWAKSPYFHMESLSVGYLVKFFSSSTSARWIPSLVETLVQHKSSWRASLISLDESFKKKKKVIITAVSVDELLWRSVQITMGVQGQKSPSFLGVEGLMVEKISQRRWHFKWDLKNSFTYSFIHSTLIEHIIESNIYQAPTMSQVLGI